MELWAVHMMTVIVCLAWRVGAAPAGMDRWPTNYDLSLAINLSALQGSVTPRCLCWTVPIWKSPPSEACRKIPAVGSRCGRLKVWGRREGSRRQSTGTSMRRVSPPQAAGHACCWAKSCEACRAVCLHLVHSGAGAREGWHLVRSTFVQFVRINDCLGQSTGCRCAPCSRTAM